MTQSEAPLSAGERNRSQVQAGRRQPARRTPVPEMRCRYYEIQGTLVPWSIRSFRRASAQRSSRKPIQTGQRGCSV
jgi:hypothetical protein